MAPTSYTLDSYLARAHELGTLLGKNLAAYDSRAIVTDLYRAQPYPVATGVMAAAQNSPYLNSTLEAYRLDTPVGVRVPEQGNYPDYTPHTLNGEHLTQETRFEAWNRAVIDLSHWVEDAGLDLADIQVEEALTDLLIAHQNISVDARTVRNLVGIYGPADFAQLIDFHFSNNATEQFLIHYLNDQGDDLDQDAPQAPLNLSGGNFHV